MSFVWMVSANHVLQSIFDSRNKGCGYNRYNLTFLSMSCHANMEKYWCPWFISQKMKEKVFTKSIVSVKAKFFLRNQQLKWCEWTAKNIIIKSYIIIERNGIGEKCFCNNCVWWETQLHDNIEDIKLTFLWHVCIFIAISFYCNFLSLRL